MKSSDGDDRLVLATSESGVVRLGGDSSGVIESEESESEDCAGESEEPC